MTLADVVTVAREAPAVVLAVLVWYELRLNREQLGRTLDDLATKVAELGTKVAVILDRHEARG